MMTPWYFLRSATRWIYQDSEFRNSLRSLGLDSLEALSARQLGHLVTNHRSSWVRKVGIGGVEYYVKTYSYESWSDRWRGVARTTIFAPSRVSRERSALEWLAAHGFGGPTVRAVVEKRTLGWLSRGVLVTDAWPGDSMADLLPQLSSPDQTAVIDQLRTFVLRLHRAGFRDRNLDLRNILARLGPDGWELVKIDSPRHCIVQNSDPNDALAKSDWQRLTASLHELGFEL
jgi:hypothetical protein